MKYQLDIYGCLYLGITISFIIGIIFNINNILNCLTTYNYQVWICNVNSQLILTIGLGILWSIMTIFHIISLFCIKEVNKNE
jgi:hypothetical protein